MNFNEKGGRTLRIAVEIIVLAVILLMSNAGAVEEWHRIFGGSNLAGETYTVDDRGGANYTRIQDAVDNASNGDTILVYSGTYYENVNVNKRLILLSIDSGGGKPVVDARRSGSAINLSAGNSTLDGFVATNASRSNGGIEVISNNNNIKNNTAMNNGAGIYLDYSSNNTLSGNNASNNNYGIDLYYSSNNTLSGNDAQYNSIIGIYLYISSSNTLSGNNASNNGGAYLYSYGIDLYYSSNNTLSSNHAQYNSDGIHLESSGSNTLSSNYVQNNGFGIYMKSSSNNNTLNGNYAQNNYYGIYLSSSSNNTLRGNNASNIRPGGTYLDSYGIYLGLSSRNTLSGNYASNKYYGIALISSSNNMLSGNNASTGNRYGIRLSSSSNNNTLSGNDASNNYYGIYLSSSGRNTLYQNNLVNNAYYNAYDNGNNPWDNDGIGNHYSNFDESGEGCADSDGNGVCDSSYSIPGGWSVDRYPLVSWSAPVGPRTITVDDSGGADYTRIQDAIKAASAGDTVQVYSGTYYENVNITRQVILLGIDTGEGIPVVNAGGNGSAITLSAGDSTLDGFTATNSGSNWGTAGIYIISNNNTLANNTIDGLLLENSDQNAIINNRVTSIFFNFSGNNTLANNYVSSDSLDGIILYSSSSNTIYNNYFNNTNNFYFYGVVNKNIWNISKVPGTNIAGGPNVGGNFWVTPNGTGFSQKCLDGDDDGICDSAYTLGSGNIDYLPLSLNSSLIIHLPGMTAPPTDPDNDGIYEDLNGNGRKDFNDVVLFFNNLEWIPDHEPVSAFDFNGNSRVDFADIVRLFEEI